MSVTTSAEVGYLRPYGTQPPDDGDLDRIFHDLVVGVTALPADMVRPRWQEGTPPKDPPSPGTNWCAVGVTEWTPEFTGALVHHSDANTAVGGGQLIDGYSELRQHEVLGVLCSFYGSNARGNASQFKNGLQIPQNREALFINGMGFVGVDAPVQVPELINDQQWRRRVDVKLYVRRIVVRTYPVQNLVEAVGTINKETGAAVPFDSNNAR